MNEQDPRCAALRPLLFAAIDGEVDRAERLELHAHLAICELCRSWERGERALTALLTDARQPVRAVRSARSRALAFAGALCVAAIVLLLLPSAAPRASLVERHLGPDLAWQVTGERALDGGDVVDVPAAASATVQLGDGVQLDAVGPARFVLDSSGRRWRVAVRAGTVAAVVGTDRTLAVGRDASQQLGAGCWLLTATRVLRQTPEPAPQDPAPRDTEALLADGLGRFQSANIARFQGALHADAAGEREHLVAAERLLRAVLAAKDVTPEQERRASFYLAASVSRQGRDNEAFGLNEQWLARHPDGPEAASVRFFMANHLRQQGQSQRARALFERVLRDEGETQLGSAARSYLEMMQGGGAGTRAQPQERDVEELTATRPPAKERAAHAGGYLVVTVDLDAARAADAGYAAAARSAQAFHAGQEWAWDGADFAALERQLRLRAPANVLFVLRPDQLDLVLHRRVLLLATAIDDDWFADFAFGYLTAENGAACKALWPRIADLHRRGPLDGGVWWQASVTSNKTSLVYENAPPALAAQAGFRGPHYYFSTANADREATIARALATMPSASVVEITGCGDPQGIWLFDDHRNLQREKHWDYAPERVGEDPDGAMPRLLAQRFRSVELASPILWSGTCHCGAVCRVFVEGDIVSTFGRTERATVHRLAPKDSLALSWLAAGAASMLVPLGANHGMSVSMEVDFALRNGASLGETMKSTYDDVLLAAKGELVLDLPVDGQPHQNREQAMQGGGSNRILIGDPALKPFRAVNGTAEVVVAERTDAGLRVTVERAAGWQPRAWDMFGTSRDRDWRVIARVDLGALQLADRTQFTARVTARGADGAALPYTMQRLAVEDHCGHRYLHLQCNGPRKQLSDKACTVVFEIAAK